MVHQQWAANFDKYSVLQLIAMNEIGGSKSSGYDMVN